MVDKFEKFLYDIKKLGVKELSLADGSTLDMTYLKTFIKDKNEYFSRVNYQNLLKSWIRSPGLFMKKHIVK